MENWIHGAPRSAFAIYKRSSWREADGTIGPYVVMISGDHEAESPAEPMTLQQLRTLHYDIGKELVRAARRKADEARRVRNERARDAK